MFTPTSIVMELFAREHERQLVQWAQRERLLNELRQTRSTGALKRLSSKLRASYQLLVVR